MKLKVDEILDRVDQIETERAGYRKAAETWENMWMLNNFDKSSSDARKEDGVELVTTPTPYNTVQLNTRFVGSLPRITVPTSIAEEDDELAAQKRERWLSALWERSNRQQRTDLIADGAWWSSVRGRHVYEVKWIKDLLPKRLRETRLPILIRTLDPFNVGTKQGPYYTEYAYHKWNASRLVARQWFPKLKWESLGGKEQFSVGEEDEEIELIDFWWLGKEGEVWNAIIVEGEQFGKKPTVADYYSEVPIVEGYADSSPIDDEMYKGISILHPLKDIWPLECRQASYMATAMMYYFNPIIVGKGPNTENIELGPGADVTGLTEEDSISFVQPAVNMPLAEGIMSKVDSMIQTSTFPNVMYGQQPGQVQAGYAINTLAQQAQTRAGRMRMNLESTVEIVNQIALGLVEKAAGDEGVTVWGKDEGSGNIYHETLNAKDIGGYYENTVMLIPEAAQDEAQRINLALQMVQAGGISWETARDKFIRTHLPKDEALRVATEQAMQGDLSQKMQLRALQKRFPDTWEQMVAGTPYEQLAQQEQQPEESEMPEMPPEMPMEQAPMPPDMMMAPPGGQMPPDMGGGGPPSMPPMPNGPMGAGLPPTPAPVGPGLMSAPESGGIPPDIMAVLSDPNTPPEIIAQILGNAPPSLTEQLRQMGALPPEGMG